MASKLSSEPLPSSLRSQPVRPWWRRSSGSVFTVTVSTWPSSPASFTNMPTPSSGVPAGASFSRMATWSKFMSTARARYFFPRLSPFSATSRSIRPLLTAMGSVFVPAMAASRRCSTSAPAGMALAWAALMVRSHMARPPSYRLFVQYAPTQLAVSASPCVAVMCRPFASFGWPAGAGLPFRVSTDFASSGPAYRRPLSTMPSTACTTSRTVYVLPSALRLTFFALTALRRLTRFLFMPGHARNGSQKRAAGPCDTGGEFPLGRRQQR